MDSFHHNSAAVHACSQPIALHCILYSIEYKQRHREQGPYYTFSTLCRVHSSSFTHTHIRTVCIGLLACPATSTILVCKSITSTVFHCILAIVSGLICEFKFRMTCGTTSTSFRQAKKKEGKQLRICVYLCRRCTYHVVYRICVWRREDRVRWRSQWGNSKRVHRLPLNVGILTHRTIWLGCFCRIIVTYRVWEHEELCMFDLFVFIIKRFSIDVVFIYFYLPKSASVRAFAMQISPIWLLRQQLRFLGSEKMENLPWSGELIHLDTNIIKVTRFECEWPWWYFVDSAYTWHFGDVFK